MKKLPCKTCIVRSMCTAEVLNNNLSIIGNVFRLIVREECSILSDFAFDLEEGGTVATNMAWDFFNEIRSRSLER